MIAIKRETNRQSIAWIRDQYKLENLVLDPPYQRRSVWTPSYQQFFIDSILRNYPIPSILINEDVLENGRIKYNVIDGKQRLTAIIEFLEDRFPLGKDSEDNLKKKYYSELEQELKNQFLSYRLPFEVFSIPESGTETIRQIYDRFNRNVIRLNDQELRRAKFTGVFALQMEELANQLADDPFWAGLKLFSRSQVRRMLDVEYVAELYVLTRDGVKEPDVLEDYYSKYDDELPDVEKTLRSFENIKREMARLDSSFRKLGTDLKDTRYSNLNDFYSLWAAVRELLSKKKKINYAKTCKNLLDFAEDVEAAVPNYEGERQPSDDAQQYSNAVRQGANKKNNRELRAELISKRFALKK